MKSCFKGWFVVIRAPEFPFFCLVCNPSSEHQLPVSLLKPEQLPAVLSAAAEGCSPQIMTSPPAVTAVSGGTPLAAKNEPKEHLPVQLAARLNTVAIEGLTDEELSDSGGEGMYRERDEFVVRNEDIDILKVCAPGNAPRCTWPLCARVSWARVCSFTHPGDDERRQRASSRLESPEGPSAEICARVEGRKEGLLSHQQRKQAVVYTRSRRWLTNIKTVSAFCSVSGVFWWRQGHVPKGICQVPGHR